MAEFYTLSQFVRVLSINVATVLNVATVSVIRVGLYIVGINEYE